VASDPFHRQCSGKPSTRGRCLHIYSCLQRAPCAVQRAMEFADRRARKAEVDWWKTSCGPCNTLDVPKLLAQTDTESVELLQTELHRCRQRGLCSACGRLFMFGSSLGQWQCKDRATGMPQDHHRAERTDSNCAPPDAKLLAWHYHLLVHIEALSPCDGPGRRITQNSGQIEHILIRRSPRE
jgi:hypothetical protein